MQRNDIYLVNLDPVQGSEQGGLRPALLISNDIGNKYSPCVIVAILTSRNNKAHMPTHIWLNPHTQGLSKHSMVECEQLRTIDKNRLVRYIGHISEEDSLKVDNALKVSLGITI